MCLCVRQTLTPPTPTPTPVDMTAWLPPLSPKMPYVLKQEGTSPQCRRSLWRAGRMAPALPSRLLLGSAWSNRDKHMLGRLLVEYQGPLQRSSRSGIVFRNAAVSCRMCDAGHPRGAGIHTETQVGADTGATVPTDSNDIWWPKKKKKNTSWHCFR